jgi:hypothetical protein
MSDELKNNECKIVARHCQTMVVSNQQPAVRIKDRPGAENKA